jgi:glucan endo-1,3-alpha-glucosidase
LIDRCLPCGSPNDAVTLRKYVTDYATHPNQLIYYGRVLVTTFAGSSCTFGHNTVSDGWVSEFTSRLTGSDNIWFVPAFFDDVSTYSSFSGFMDGALNVNIYVFSCTQS